MGSLLVSINCTTYNHEKYITDAIEGFLMQITNFEFEILIGEDCSTDNTMLIVEQYANSYPDKIRVITSAQNVGARNNSQRLWENSKGKYIAECEGDDYWTDPYKLQNQVDYMENHPDCSLCFHAVEIVQATQKTGMKISPYALSKVSPISDIIIGGGGFCPTVSLMYPKKLMENVPDFYLRAHVGDYPMQLILASKGSVYYFNKCMAVYRIGVKGSWSNRRNIGESNKEKMIRINKGDITLLTEFNSFTNFLYKREIEFTVLKKEFEIQLLKGNKSAMKDCKYKEYKDGLSTKQKLKLYSRCFLPNLYLGLARLKPFIYRIFSTIKSFKRKEKFNATR